MLQGLGSQGSGSQISLSKVTGSQIARFAKTLFRHLAKFMSTLVLTLGVVSAWLAGQPGMLPPVFADDHVMHPLYLPLVQNAPQAGPTTQPTPVTPAPATPTPPVEPLASAFFADMQWRTSSASFATDAQGGNHLAYLYYNGLAEDVPTSGVYQFCARDCEKADQWQGVRLGEQVNEIQLALTPQGRPRILYRTPTQSNGWAFFYAACDDRCADAASWSVTQVTSNQGMAPLEKNDDELPQRYFALDNGGRPRFVYNDRAGTHYGTFYTFCDANCNERSNWHETRINKDNGNNGPYRDEDFFYPVLTFSPSGQPRVVADGASMQDEFFLYYVACDSGCDQAANWQSAPIFPRGFGFEFSYDVEINANGQPRIAIYEAAYLGGGGNVLSYAWCNEQCTQPAKWQRQALGLESLEGQEPDLELDAAGRPHIAYASYRGGGVGYSTCSAACESTEPTWQHTVVETRTDLDNAWPVAMPLICSGGIWDGLTPSLSLDANGAPHIAYDATFYARCHYVGEDKWEPWNEMNLVWRAVRVRLTGHGATPGTPGGTPTSVPTVTQTPTPSVTPTATTSPAPTVTATPTPPLPARLGTGSFPESAWRTSSSDVAVDEENGTHVAYVYTEALYAPDPDGDSNPTAAVYRTCAAACEQAQNWSSVTLGADVSEVQVEVTAEGKPRLLLLVRAEQNGAAADRYVYAECNQQCTNAANWLLTPIVTVPNDLSRHWIADPSNIEDGGRENQARRYFALDPAGRPRFIYYHYNADADPTGVGAYYAACDSNCTDAANWSHTRITAVDDWSGVLEWEVLEDPVLTFAPDGSPRILAPMLPLGILRFPGLYYIACDAACDMSSSWVKVQVGNGDDASGQYDLALDQAGRPFVVISYWWQAGLRYAWCDSGCSDMFNWQVAQGPELEIGNPALALNGQDQPQVVYSTTEYDETGNNADHSLYWLQCDANCRSTDALWSTVRVETSEHLRAEWPKNIPAACAAGEWSQLAPAVSIAAGGLAHIAVDVVYVAPCEYDAGAGTWQSGQYSTVWRAARVVSLPTP